MRLAQDSGPTFSDVFVVVSRSRFKPLTRNSKEADVVLLWVLVALVLLFAIVGGIAISKFLFFILIVAAVLALIGLFTRTA
jgi:hypothetical protein